MRIRTLDRRPPRQSRTPDLPISLLAIAAVALLATVCVAQWTPYGTAPSSFGNLRFIVDVASVPTLEGGSTVEISYSVTYDELPFIRHEGRFRARFEVTAVLYDGDGRQVAGDTWPRAVVLDSFDDTNSRKLAAREVLRVDVPEGRYRLKVELRSLDSRSVGYVERTIDVASLAPGHLLLGTVEFERVESDPETGEERFVPNPSRQYGQENPLVRIIVPTYADSGTPYRLDMKVKTVGGETQLELSDSLAQDGWHTEHSQQFSVLDLEVGDYILHTRAHPPAGDTAETEARFRVLTSPRSWGEDFGKMMSQISYVASRRDLEELENAPEEERDEAWNGSGRSRTRIPRLRTTRSATSSSGGWVTSTSSSARFSRAGRPTWAGSTSSTVSPTMWRASRAARSRTHGRSGTTTAITRATCSWTATDSATTCSSRRRVSDEGPEWRQYHSHG